MTTNTTIAHKAARRKLNLLELASDLDNVSQACRIIGYSRQQFYEIRRDFQTFGSQGLLDKVRGPKNPHPNRVSEELEQTILDYCLEFPTHGCVKVCQQLHLRGVNVGSGAVRGVWQRHSLLSKHQRLLRLEKHCQANGMSLTDAQIRLLERFDPEFRERHIQADHTGHLVAIDTFMVGNLKGIGKVYLQTVVDCHSRYAWGNLYTSKLPITAVHVLNDKVLPFFDEHGAKINTILSDNGREFCGREDRHPFELFLQLEEIEHRTTQVRRPQSNGIVERLHKTLLDEHFRVKGRVVFYESIEQMQADLDEYLVLYNTERAHQGRNMNGRTPHQAFVEGLPPPQQEVQQA